MSTHTLTERKEIAQRAADGLRRFAAQAPAPRVMIGFDGCVDSIIEVVDKRHDAQNYEPVSTIEHFGDKIMAAAGKSSNYELIVKQQKLGGNGPIMANAMARMGAQVTCVGALGYPSIHPVYEDLATRAECVSIAEVGCTDALEFSDGKLMLGKIGSFEQVGWDLICDKIGERKFEQMVARSSLVGMVNWTMLPKMGELWRVMTERLLHQNGDGLDGQRLVFIDLADPEKRTRDDLREALEQCTAMQKWAGVIVGLNLKEAIQVGRVLDVEQAGSQEPHIETLAQQIRDTLNLHAVVVHPRHAAAAACDVNGTVATDTFSGPYVETPKISTGGGDHFNAGFCLAQLAGLPLVESLCVGTATSGYYVRNAKTPDVDDLIKFCEDLPRPQEP